MPALTMSDSKHTHRRRSRSQAKTETWLMTYDAQVHSIFVRTEWEGESTVIELWSAVLRVSMRGLRPVEMYLTKLK